jgi:sporulation related protein
MSPGRDPGRLGNDGLDMDEQDDESPRSLFSALWFRTLLAVLVLGVLAAIAVPYVLDLPTTSPLKFPSAKSATATPPAAETAAPVTPPANVATAETPATPATSEPPAASEATAAPRAKSEEPSTPTARPASPKSAVAKTAAPKPPATKPAAAAKPTMMAKAEAPKPAPKEVEKPVAKAAESAKKSAGTEKAAPKAAETTKPIPPTPVSAAAGRPYWVQVGAFKDSETAKKIAARLRDQGMRVEESAMVPGAARASSTQTAQTVPDRYDVLVSGVSAADIEPKLASKGLKGENTANGAVVRPSLALREAVALSRDLADAGLSVQVRRIGGPAPAVTPGPAPTPSASPGAVQTLYRVRVGSYTDRAAAVEAMKQLEDKGFKPFIARGNE